MPPCKAFAWALVRSGARRRFDPVVSPGAALAENCSIGGGEPLADVPGLFDLVEDGDGEVLAADAALAFGILHELVETEAEFAGPLAGRDRGGRRDGRPVEIVDRANLVVGLERRQRGGRLHALLGHVVVVPPAVGAQQAAR